MTGTRPEVRLAAMTSRARFVVVDVETTPSDEGDRVLSIGVVTCTVTAGGSVAVTGTLDLLCDPGVPIENTWFHGIRDADVAGKPPLCAHIPALDAAMTAYPGETLYFVAQNAVFDVGVLKREYDRASATFPALPVLDTLDMSRALGVKAGSHKLAALAAHFHVPARTAHVALDDALTAADVLGRLLDLAATDGHDDLAAIRGLLPSGRRSTTDIDARPAVRVARARDSAYTHVDVPEPHLAGHVPLPGEPTTADLDAWLDHARQCVTLRCPLLPDRAATVPTGHDYLADHLTADLDGYLAAGDHVSAATALGALLRLLPGTQPTSRAAVAWHDRWAPLLRAMPACARVSVARIDGCPDCRADRGCPADTWHHALARIVTNTTEDWPMPRASRSAWAPASGGRVATHATAGRTEMAGYVAWLVADAWDTDHNRPQAVTVARMAAALELVEPRLVLLDAADLAGTDLASAVELLDDALAFRTTDRAWRTVASYRDALAGRLTFTTRPTETHGNRIGHTRPPSRTPRRRFTTVPR